MLMFGFYAVLSGRGQRGWLFHRLELWFGEYASRAVLVGLGWTSLFVGMVWLLTLGLAASM